MGCLFLFSSRRRHTRFDCDWSSDVCSSDLYAEYRDRSQAFAGLAASLPTESSLEVNDETHLATAEAVSGNYSETMGLPTTLGRWFTDENEPVAVLSYDA